MNCSFPSRTSWPLVSLSLALAACGSPPESKAPENLALVDDAPARPIERVDVAVTELSRADVVRVIDDGFGKFLQDAELAVQYAEGRYVGYRIVRIHNTERYRGVGLEPGDVITQVNGKSIEREEQAFEVFRSLKDAAFLEVSYLRQGEPMRLSLPIVGDAPANSSKAPPTSEPAASPAEPAGTPQTGSGALAPKASSTVKDAPASDTKAKEPPSTNKKAKK